MNDRTIPPGAADAPPGLEADALAPFFRRPLAAGAGSIWWAHAPFVHWLVHQLRPACVVELGGAASVSCAAFCQAIREEELAARCIAMDIRPDQAAAEETGLSLLCAAQFGGFLTRLRTAPGDVGARFAGGEIDLLHLDGPAAGAGLRPAFESIRPKLSASAVVLVHGIGDAGSEAGSLWRTLRAGRPAIALPAGAGLGVLALGPQAHPAVVALAALPEARLAAFRDRAALLGERWALENHVPAEAERLAREAVARNAEARRDAIRAEARAGGLAEELARARARIQALTTAAGMAEEELAQARARMQALAQEVEAAEAARAAGEAASAAARTAREAERAHAERELARLAAEHRAVLASTSWRITGPVRRVAAVIPHALRRRGRGAA